MHAAGVNIRHATQDDLPALTALALAWLAESPVAKQLPKDVSSPEREALLRGQLGRMLRLEAEFDVLVAEHDDHGLIGFAVGQITFPWFLTKARQAVLLALWAPHQHRQAGTTGRLLAHWFALEQVATCTLQSVHVQEDTENVGLASLMRMRGCVLAEQAWTRGPRKPSAKE